MHHGCVRSRQRRREGSGGVVADIAKLSVGREEYYTRELATDHEQYLSGHGESRPGGCPTCYRRCRRSSGRRGWPGWPTGPGCGFAPASDRLPR